MSLGFWLSESSTTRCLDNKLVPGFNLDAASVAHGHHLTVGPLKIVLPHLARLTAIEAERRNHASIGQHGNREGSVEDDVPLNPIASVEFSFACDG